MLTKSIRWRLQLWHGLILVAVLAGFGLTAYQVAWDNQLQRIDRELDQQLLGAFHPQPPAGRPERFPGPPPEERPPSPPDGPPEDGRFGPADRQPGWQEWALSAEVLNSRLTNGFYYVLWRKDGSVLVRSPGAPAGIPIPERTGPEPPMLNRDSLGPGEPPRFRPLVPAPSTARTRGQFRERFRFEPFGQCLLVGHSVATDLAAMHRLAFWLVAAGATVLLLGLAGGWWLAGRAIRPIQDIGATATKIAAGDLSQRIDTAETESELGHLAALLNATFARLEAAFAQQQQFTADASHELRTPLAVMISEAQTCLARERHAEAYRETIEGCLSTAQQMRRLTESLLELARFDAGQVALVREPFDLSQVVREAAALLRPLAETRGITLACDLPRAECVADTQRIRQVVTNLLTNAIHFNREHGNIRVSVAADAHSVVLAVADTGEGILEKDLPHIFERFYRADQSRSRARGGTGLGLAICKAIINAHSGSIQVSSQLGVGSTFTVRLPKN